MIIERSEDTRTYTLQEISEINSEAALTSLEGWFLGNTPTEQGAQEPIKPNGIFRGLNVEQINTLRQEQGRIVSVVAGMILGMDIKRQIPLLALAQVNADTKTVETLPRVCGIYDTKTGRVNTDIKLVEKHQLTKEMVELQLNDCRKSRAVTV